ncbi:3-deoxy-manno-octulosonate cytidylyltransferase [Rubripirellula reticaptiva]|uniref:3-deoxy-manno-octulosonate cytidylyltransferase n=1 Tax=Rubripirellula reticaptiva TaxID=2528013 RepID=A0A5C6FAG5_9BACT|nr:3-deoxy-manno-octulosonate cytidylyltransferase [Rubripirellula reticaptiva]TWU57404.1 3-deoxy-manno-octulosonate cytidylyltransferase [Rubripirellula reticaptiva]
MPVNCQIVIPARLASTRLPEKLLRKVSGKSVLQYTYEAALQSKLAKAVVIAVDDERMAREVDVFGGKWVMTRVDHASGTDRIAEVASQFPSVDVFVNVQGDEPEIDPETIDSVAKLLIDDQAADMATAGTPIRDLERLSSPSCVKIVMAGYESNGGESTRDQSSENGGQTGKGRAVYFSRAVVPHSRDASPESMLDAEPPIYWHHLGIYAYRREFLSWFAQQSPSVLEMTERLEQLRAIEAGKRILVARVESATAGIDTESDLQAFATRLARR